ncbi:GNAT family N-acetyltransferase [Aliivibrio kagoshimensis]|uniref:GNAT family N-acetyltransferase n=1 Tax=Aliivibrio kagoshimensis TaxID=2910230 RepID=UPI003D12A9FA
MNHSNKEVAKTIFTLFQRSYQMEADLIGVVDFPPLSRRSNDIEQVSTQFYGFYENDVLAAVIEVEIEDKQLDIHSLTVDPAHFRKGIAGKLIHFVVDKMNFSQAIVETAAANIPAINLYKKHGFVECKQWTPSHGIPKVALLLDNSML